MKVLINLGKGKCFQYQSKADNQLDAAAEVMMKRKFYRLSQCLVLRIRNEIFIYGFTKF